MNVFAKFDEIPSITLQDIKETKRHGRTFVRTDNVKTVYPPTNTVCRGIINISHGPRGHASSVGSMYASQRVVLLSVFVSGTLFCLKSISLFGISCFKKSKRPVTGEKWALNTCTCTGKLTSGDLPRKSVVK